MYTTFTKTDNGLRIDLTDAGKARIKELAEPARALNLLAPLPWGDAPVFTTTDFYDLIEHQLCNGWDLVSPDAIGALTSNPYLLTDDPQYDYSGNVIIYGTIYAYDNYQINDPLDDLERNGYVLFTAYPDAVDQGSNDYDVVADGGTL